MNSIFSTKYWCILLAGVICSAISCLFYSPEGSTLPSLIVTALFILLSMNMTMENQLYMVALSLPNTKALGIGGISASIFVCTIAVVMYFLKGKKRLSIPFLAILITLYCLQYLIRNDDILMGAVMPVKTLANILFFTFISFDNEIAKDSYHVGLKASIAMFFGIFSAFFASIIGGSEAGRMTIAGNDPNMISVEVAFVLSYLSVAFFTRRQIPNMVYLVMAFVLGVISLMCGSRMGMLLYVFIIIASIMLNTRHVGKSLLLLIVLGIAGAAFLLSPMGQTMIEVFTLRMELLEQADNLSNGRFEIWEQYFSVLNSNDLYWLFGLGSYEDYGLEEMAHNFLIEDVASYGIIGVIILYSTYIEIYRRQYRHSFRTRPFKPTLYYKIPFLVPLIGSLTLHGLGSIMVTTMLYIGVLCMVGSEEKRINNIINESSTN